MGFSIVRWKTYGSLSIFACNSVDVVLLANTFYITFAYRVSGLKLVVYLNNYLLVKLDQSWVIGPDNSLMPCRQAPLALLTILCCTVLYVVSIS